MASSGPVGLSLAAPMRMGSLLCGAQVGSSLPTDGHGFALNLRLGYRLPMPAHCLEELGDDQPSMRASNLGQRSSEPAS